MTRATDLRRLAGRAKRKGRRTLTQASRRTRAQVAVRRLPVGHRWALRRIEGVVAAKPATSVCLLVTGETRVASLVRAAHPRARITVIDVHDGPPSLPVRLAARGRYGLLVDLTDRPLDPAELLSSALFQVSATADYLIPLRRRGRVPESLRSLFAHLAKVRADEVEDPTSDERHLARATRDVAFEPDGIVVTNRVNGLAKLRESDVEYVMSVRGPQFGEVLEKREGVRFTSRADITDHAADSVTRVPEEFEAPTLYLRTYREATCAMRQVTVKANLALPETYRKMYQTRLVNLGIKDVAADFAAPVRDLWDSPRLPGTWFTWDNEHPGHFGHILTEQVSRLWAWEAAKSAYPDLRMLVSRYSWRSELQPAELAILRAAGIDPDDVTLIRGTTRVERLVGATGMFCSPAWVDPRIADTWRALAPRIVAEATVDEFPERIFISRRGGTRDCLNLDEVEQLFQVGRASPSSTPRCCRSPTRSRSSSRPGSWPGSPAATCST